MKPLVVLTATYNHPEELNGLYQTLINQNDLAFTWIIVNDGSREETKALIDQFQNDEVLDIVAIHQENGGKSKAINAGIDRIEEETEFFVIIDDDEKLYNDAVTTIKKYVDTYRDTECGVIHFNRKDEKGNVIASPYFDNDYFMSYQEHKNKGYHADGYLGYFKEKVGDLRFNIHRGEKYVAPSTLFMKVTQDSKLLWASAVLGETEYLAGGITKQGRKLRIRNPLGMIEYCELMQENGADYKTRAVYSTYGYAYAEISGQKYTGTKLSGSFKLFGKALALFWKRKYRAYLNEHNK